MSTPESLAWEAHQDAIAEDQQARHAQTLWVMLGQDMTGAECDRAFGDGHRPGCERTPGGLWRASCWCVHDQREPRCRDCGPCHVTSGPSAWTDPDDAWAESVRLHKLAEHGPEEEW